MIIKEVCHYQLKPTNSSPRVKIADTGSYYIEPEGITRQQDSIKNIGDLKQMYKAQNCYEEIKDGILCISLKLYRLSKKLHMSHTIMLLIFLKSQ